MGATIRERTGIVLLAFLFVGCFTGPACAEGEVLGVDVSQHNECAHT